MAASLPTAFRDDSNVRDTEVPNADWDAGMNWGGSNAPGIGINMLQGAIVGTPEQFTLIDQFGDVRVPQVSAQIGHEDGDAVRYGTNDSGGSGELTPTSNCTLNTLSAGWVAGA